MTWPLLPLVLRVKRGAWPSVWLPLVVLWPLILLAFCFALPVCVVWSSRRGSAIATVKAGYHTLCAMHGSEFELSTPEHGSWRFSLY